MDSKIENWLMEGDPSVVWQVMTLLGYEKDEIQKKRNEMEIFGWVKKILEFQSADGSWGGGLYSPKFISTTYTLLLLKRIGIKQENKTCQKSIELLFKGVRPDGGINFSPKKDARSETCITGMVLNLVSYFKSANKQVEEMYRYIQANQMEDGGWNCQYPIKATHASFNTTMLVLEGLQSYRTQNENKKNEIEDIEKNGREFLLNHRLFKSHKTGEIVKEDYLRFPFPYQWKYDVLIALDYFQSRNAPYDERLEDAINLIKAKSKEGIVKNYRGQSGKLWFTMEPVGKPSRYNTLRWQRIQKWWNKIS